MKSEGIWGKNAFFQCKDAFKKYLNILILEKNTDTYKIGEDAILHSFIYIVLFNLIVRQR